MGPGTEGGTGVVMMIRAALICLLLAGCVKPYTLKGAGEVAPPPVGWNEHCETIPKPDECPK